MLAIGIPAMITNAIIPVSAGIVVAMIATFGVDAVAGFGVAMRIEPMFLIPFYALSAVSSPFFGQNFGSGQFDRLLQARRAVARFCLGFGLLLAAVLILIARPLTGLFSESESIQGVAVHYLWIVSISYGAYGLVMSCNASFNGMGKPIPGRRHVELPRHRRVPAAGFPGPPPVRSGRACSRRPRFRTC